jgi:hypothetical protein
MAAISFTLGIYRVHHHFGSRGYALRNWHAFTGKRAGFVYPRNRIAIRDGLGTYLA